MIFKYLECILDVKHMNVYVCGFWVVRTSLYLQFKYLILKYKSFQSKFMIKRWVLAIYYRSESLVCPHE